MSKRHLDDDRNYRPYKRRNNYSNGDSVEVYSTKTRSWFKARVTREDGDRVQVTYSEGPRSGRSKYVTTDSPNLRDLDASSSADETCSSKNAKQKTKESAPDAGTGKFKEGGSRNPRYDGPVGLFINNEFRPSRSGKKFKTVNPANEEVLAEVYEGDKEDVDEAVRAARRAFDDKSEWRTMDKSKRRDLMLKLADLLEKNRKRFALWESLDQGKPVTIADSVDVQLSINCIRYYAGWADKQQGKTIPIDGNFFCYTSHEPVGVVGQIIPWNFPLLMQVWKLGPALATGCCVVMKLSEKTPLTGLMLCELIREAGFPAGVVNVLNGYGPTAGAAISSHMDVNKVAFTGSSGVGQIIMKAAAMSNMKRVTLELGGKSPLIVFPDADIDQALEAARVGLFFNTGQCCIAGSRVFVHDKIYDEFVRKAKEGAEKQLTGDPNDKDVFLGPVVDDVQFRSVMKFIEQGKREGARLVTGGRRLGRKGYYIAPTIFADVTDDMKICSEEIFGPVMSIIRWRTTEEVVKRANNTKYGLGAGVCTRDVANAINITKQLKAGTVYVNCYDKFDAAAPFGGFKQSGIGRELGEYGLQNYTEVKCVIMSLDKPGQSSGGH